MLPSAASVRAFCLRRRAVKAAREAKLAKLALIRPLPLLEEKVHDVEDPIPAADLLSEGYRADDSNSSESCHLSGPRDRPDRDARNAAVKLGLTPPLRACPYSPENPCCKKKVPCCTYFANDADKWHKDNVRRHGESDADVRQRFAEHRKEHTMATGKSYCVNWLTYWSG